VSGPADVTAWPGETLRAAEQALGELADEVDPGCLRDALEAEGRSRRG
jgi:hypothetical protein